MEMKSGQCRIDLKNNSMAMPFVISAVWTFFHVAILMQREEK